MKLWFLFVLLFIGYISSAQTINITDSESDSLGKSLKALYSLEDSVKYYKSVEDFIKEDTRRLKMDIAVKKALLEYQIQDLIEKYNVPTDYVFKMSESGKLYFMRKEDGNDSGS